MFSVPDVDVRALVRVANVMLNPNHGGQIVNQVDLPGQAVNQLQVEDQIMHVIKARMVEQMPHLGDRAVSTTKTRRRGR